MRRLIDNPDERRELGAAAHRVGQSAHDADANRARLFEALTT